MARNMRADTTGGACGAHRGCPRLFRRRSLRAALQPDGLCALRSAMPPRQGDARLAAGRGLATSRQGGCAPFFGYRGPVPRRQEVVSSRSPRAWCGPAQAPAMARPLGAAVRAAQQAMMPPLLLRSLHPLATGPPPRGNGQSCASAGWVGGVGRAAWTCRARVPIRQRTRPGRLRSRCATIPAAVGIVKRERSPCLRRFRSACSGCCARDCA
jgi:hypothetical protein